MMSDTQKRRTIAILTSWCLLLALATGLFIWFANVNRRSIPGRILRWCKGEGEYDQIIKDLAEDIRQKPELAQLQAWSLEILTRFRAGQIHTAGSPSNLSAGLVMLAPEEIPAFVSRFWTIKTNDWGEREPEIAVKLSANDQPESVCINWYAYGIEIGPPDYRISYESNLCVEAKPGIYVFHTSK